MNLNGTDCKTCASEHEFRIVNSKGITLPCVTKKKMSADASIVLNRYIQAVVLPAWEARGRKFNELAKKADVPAAAISKCNSEGKGLGLDPIVRIAAATGSRNFPKFWVDAYNWFEATAAQTAAQPIEPAELARCRDLPGWPVAAEQAAEQAPELEEDIRQAGEMRILPEWRPGKVTVKFVLQMAIIASERGAKLARMKRDSSTMPSGRK